MTLTPSARAISLCNFPCVAISFARTSFVAISALECLFFFAIVASFRPPCCFRSSSCWHKFLCVAQRVVPCSGRGTDIVVVSRKKQPGQCYHLLGCKINMTCVGGCVGTKCVRPVFAA